MKKLLLLAGALTVITACTQPIEQPNNPEQADEPTAAPTNVSVTNGPQQYTVKDCWCYPTADGTVLQVAVEGPRGAGFTIAFSETEPEETVTWWNPTIEGAGVQMQQRGIESRQTDLVTSRGDNSLTITGTIHVESGAYYSDGAIRTWIFDGTVNCHNADIANQHEPKAFGRR